MMMTFAAVFAAMMMFTLTACGDDDEGGNGSVVGDWATVQYDNSGSYMYIERLNLMSNGTFSCTDYDIFGQNLNDGGQVSSIEKSSFSGTYTAVDGTLTLIANSQTRQINYKVSGNTLTLSTNDGPVEYDKVDNNIQQILNSVEQSYQAQGNGIYY